MSKDKEILKRAIELFKENGARRLMEGHDGKNPYDRDNGSVDRKRLSKDSGNLFFEYWLQALDELVGTDDYPEWMANKTTQELSEKINRDLLSSDAPLLDHDLMDIFFDAQSLFQYREKHFKFEKGRNSTDNKELDAFLFPSKKIMEVKGLLDWDIDKWEELNIVIDQLKTREIRFQKMFMGQPSKDTEEIIRVKDLHLGDKTIDIIAMFGYKSNFPLKNRNSVFRINKALKEFFKMENNPIESDKGNYTAKFQVKVYDIYGQPVIDKHIHSHGGVVQDEQQIRADEITDAIDYEDDENIYRESDDDGEELNF
ncbi:MAG: hypothetical protein HOK52_09075 [Candidatus Marinimicrobia bacterium]|jgi:hypothetical protein|nr:hypothetical protein [Candidatus Neomarinimicrobiota bacterium]MBT6471396.1 hypothetical protein [Candidatus Neomarinimicrobiota bacterium]